MTYRLLPTRRLPASRCASRPRCAPRHLPNRRCPLAGFIGQKVSKQAIELHIESRPGESVSDAPISGLSHGNPVLTVPREHANILGELLLARGADAMEQTG